MAKVLIGGLDGEKTTCPRCKAVVVYANGVWMWDHNYRLIGTDYHQAKDGE
ncbi:hypothetical protein HYZ97_01005 [Candidatus Pacearchaeota archaeon]|nr:hypothetical protein [Candidatus Pacearchaeota archaeon]